MTLRNKLITKLIQSKLFLLVLLSPAMASAGPFENKGGLDKGAGIGVDNVETSLVKKEPAIIIGIIVRTLLTLLGTFFTVLIILGGFKWMTSSGNTEKIKEAKELIKNAAIGLFVVVAAYAIVRFIFTGLQDNVNPSGRGAAGNN